VTRTYSHVTDQAGGVTPYVTICITLTDQSNANLLFSTSLLTIGALAEFTKIVPTLAPSPNSSCLVLHLVVAHLLVLLFPLSLTELTGAPSSSSVPAVASSSFTTPWSARFGEFLARLSSVLELY
jgi:hypothetical protein